MFERLSLDAQENLSAEEETTCQGARLQNTNAYQGGPERPQEEDVQGSAQAERLIDYSHFRPIYRELPILHLAVSHSETYAAGASSEKVQ